MISLGQRIRDIRLKLCLTQIDLAKGICTPSMVSQIESNRARPSYKILTAIAERLEVPLEKLLADVELHLEYASMFKMGKAMVAAGQYATAIPLLKQVLDTQRSIISEMEIQFELAECYLHTDDLTQAKHHLDSLQEQAVLRQDAYMLAKVMKSLGLIEYKRKKYQLAVYHWKKALEEFKKMEQEETFLKASIMCLLGDGHVQLGMMHEAIQYYSQAASMYEDCGNMNEIANVYLGLAKSYKRLHDFERAATYSERAFAIFNGLENVHKNIMVQMHTAIAYGKIGREAEAIQMLELSIRKLQELRKSEDAGVAYVELAKMQLSTGSLHAAEQSCHIARSLLPELHEYQAWGHRVLGDVELKRGQTEEAIRRFQMAADCFKHVNDIGEWADTMAVISRLKFAENDCQSAFRIIDEVRNLTQQTLHERGIVL